MRIRTVGTSTLIPLALAATLLLSVGCATIADDYRIAGGTQEERGYSSVAGDIEVGSSARIGNAKTVSGNIEIGEQSRVGTLSSVAGRIRVGAASKVDGSIKTVAGDIEIARGCTITGDVGTVAGQITVTDSAVRGSVTLSGGTLVLNGSRVSGALRIERADDPEAKAAEVTIGAASEVGKVSGEKGARVHLRIHRTAQVGAVQGVAAEYYD